MDKKLRTLALAAALALPAASAADTSSAASAADTSSAASAADTSSAASAAQAAGPKDPDTRAWWKMVAHLSADAMQGRDTGSAGHARAADWVARQFKAAGLKPMGDGGGWTQTVPLHELRVETSGTSFTVSTPGSTPTSLRFLHEIGVRAAPGLPARLEGQLAFRGYCGRSDVGPDVKGRILLCFGARRPGLPGAGERLAAARAAGATGLINIDDAGYTLEPMRWPEAYARRITIADGSPPAPDPAAGLPLMRLNPAALPALLAGSGLVAQQLMAQAIAAAPLAPADLPARMAITLATSERDFTSDNVLAMLPGTDKALEREVVVVSAHLDGYGFGEAINGDSLYNGAFDDAAYVATLIRLARARQGQGFPRPVLFAVFTGEEKGLLGARWFTQHPSIPREYLAANINLDAIRPLFPLKILTLIGLERSNLVDDVRAVAAPMGIEVRPDLEPIRGMIGRTDAAPFLAIGVPAVSFMFGYNNGSPQEARFRTWYRTRYHLPADDITQPIDFTAARDFNLFFDALTLRVASRAGVPEMVK